MIDTAGHCESVVREQDPDRYFATLFAQATHRPSLFALYAFNAEVARVRDSVSEPLPGEIRLTWWREVLEGTRPGEAEAHPVARALIAAIRENRLPVQAFVRLIDARILDLYDDPVPTVTHLEGYAGDTSSALIRLASIILAGGRDPGGAEAAGHAGVAYAVTGLLRALPFHAQRGQVFIPVDVLARNGARREDILHGRATPHVLAALRDMRALARRHLSEARARASQTHASGMAAFLPLALVEPYLQRMERRGYDPFRVQVTVPQWRRQATLWIAARRRRPMG